MEHSRLTRNLIAVLLLASAVTTLPTANSQQFTTSTAFLTSTLTQTNTSNTPTFGFTTSTETTTPEVAVTFYSITEAVCYSASGTFNSTGSGTTHIDYSVGSPMTLYVVSLAIPDFAIGIAFAMLPMIGPKGTCNSPLSLTGEYTQYNSLIFRKSLSGSGSFDLNLPPKDNPYGWLIMVPMVGYPTATLGIGKQSETYTNTIEVPTWMPVTFASSRTTTFTSSTVFEIPFTQTYNAWIVAAFVAIVVFAAIWLVTGRKTKPH